MSLSEVETSVKEIWEMFKVMDARFKETDSRLEKRFKEIDARFKKIDRRLCEKFHTPSDRQEENAAKFYDSDQTVENLENFFTSPWRRVLDYLPDNGIFEQLQRYGIKMTALSREIKSQENGRQMHLDFLLTNEEEVIIGDIRTKMASDDVRDLLIKLNEFLQFFQSYKGFKIYGAMIGLSMEEESAKYAYRKGLFVFKVGGEGMLQLLNDDKFTPKDFG